MFCIVQPEIIISKDVLLSEQGMKNEKSDETINFCQFSLQYENNIFVLFSLCVRFSYLHCEYNQVVIPISKIKFQRNHLLHFFFVSISIIQ